jgi:nitronate monooxygenase
MWVQFSGMKKLEQSVKPASYQTLWCAGQSAELIDDILPCTEIIENFKKETLQEFENLNKIFD